MFTIAVTIVRGSIFFGVYKSGEDASRKGLDPSWMVFWFFIELIVCESTLSFFDAPGPLEIC